MPARASNSRSPRGSGSQLIETLQESITSLLAENRQLKNQLDRLQERGRSGSEPIGRQLAALTRRVARAVEGGGRSSVRPTARRTAQPRKRRPITDPAMLERRRAALAKAREVRAARRAAGQSG